MCVCVSVCVCGGKAAIPGIGGEESCIEGCDIIMRRK